jgi:hypothetical protein
MEFKEEIQPIVTKYPMFSLVKDLPEETLFRFIRRMLGTDLDKSFEEIKANCLIDIDAFVELDDQKKLLEIVQKHKSKFF